MGKADRFHPICSEDSLSYEDNDITLLNIGKIPLVISIGLRGRGREIQIEPKIDRSRKTRDSNEHLLTSSI